MILEAYVDPTNGAVVSPRFYDEGDSYGLSSDEQLSVVRAIRICAGIHTIEEYSAWLSEDLDSLLHHRRWVCGLGCLHSGGFKAMHWLASSASNERPYIPQSASKTLVSPLLTHWLKVRRPQIYFRGAAEPSNTVGGNLFPPDALDNAVLHCQLDPDNTWTSVFCFANLGEKPGFRQRLLLDLLVPHLHATLCRVISEDLGDHSPSDAPTVKLTVRELQILRYIRLGGTNAEIAEQMHKSVFTVNNQVVRVLAKLGAKNRTQAVFVARQMGLFKP